ncbi:hypothetical protein FB451DRAFT_272082 [Mycena latifolia]|nr:hypothetical protein FB451DRAFT_272082 [Mycena latifolia]
MASHVFLDNPRVKILTLSLQTLRDFQVRMDPSFQATIEAARTHLSHCPQLLRIFQARKLLSRDKSLLFPDFSLGLTDVRMLLDLSWEEMRAQIGSLRPIIGRDSCQFGALLMFLPALCRELNGLYPESLVSKELAVGCIRLIQRIGNGDLPMTFWTHFERWEKHGLEWGRHIRSSSPQSNPELLHELQEFLPPWEVFESGIYTLCPTDFYDVLQWLKTSPDPQQDLIERWQGYMIESLHREGVECSDAVLETRWQNNLRTEAYFDGSPQRFDEKEIIAGWAMCLAGRDVRKKPLVG